MGRMRIGELAAKTHVSVRSLRYYEAQGLLNPSRTAAGHRTYTAADQSRVAHIQELFGAGFCSAVIRDLLPALAAPSQTKSALSAAFDAARARLTSEKESIEAELLALEALRERLGLAPDTHVRVDGELHDSSQQTQATAFDHRDRRLR